MTALPPGASVAGDSFSITPLGPFSWEQATNFLHGWAALKHQQRVGKLVRMAFPLDRTFAPVGVALQESDGVLHGRVAGTGDVAAVAAQVARIFSLDRDASDYPEVGVRDPAVGALMQRLPGLRPVLFTSPYEAAAWAVISLRISQVAAASIRGRLIAEVGEQVEVDGERVGCFPAPERLLGLRSFQGLPAVKFDRLRAVAQAALEGRLDVEALRALGDVDAPAALRLIPGIGPFWSSGIYLRACGIADVFPDEPISIAAAASLAGLDAPLSRERLDRLAEPWRPYRMWVCVLLRVAVSRGVLAIDSTAHRGSRRQGL